MPISREQVRTLCTGDEFEMYTASLRVSLAGMRPDALRSCIRRTRELISGPHDPVRRKKKPGLFHGRWIRPRKKELLAGALSRFEGRLRVLETVVKSGRNPRS